MNFSRSRVPFKLLLGLLCLLWVLFLPLGSLSAQSNLKLRVEGLKQTVFSGIHAYFLKEDGSMAVYRQKKDSLLFVFENADFGFKGKIIDQDARFAYGYDSQEQRFFIFDPTSLLLTYSAVELTFEPLRVLRQDTTILLLGSEQWASSSLSSPSAFERQLRPKFMDDSLKVQRYFLGFGDQLIGQRQQGDIVAFDMNIDADTLQWNRVDSLHQFTENALIGYLDKEYLLRWDAKEKRLHINILAFDTDISFPFPAKPLKTLRLSDGQSFAFLTAEGSLWQWEAASGLRERIRPGSELNMYVSQGQNWLRNGDRIELMGVEFTPLDAAKIDSTAGLAEPAFSTLNRISIPQSQLFLMPLPLEKGFLRPDLEFVLDGPAAMMVQDRSLLWRPALGDVGLNTMTLYVFSAQGLADSVQIEVDVRPFNSPPVFLPARDRTLVAGEETEIRLAARDPDGIDPNLMRYIGRSMPDGASIDASTAKILWTPRADQVGMHQLEVIATDQYGASSRQQIQLKVVDLKRGGQ